MVLSRPTKLDSWAGSWRTALPCIESLGLEMRGRAAPSNALTCSASSSSPPNEQTERRTLRMLQPALEITDRPLAETSPFRELSLCQSEGDAVLSQGFAEPGCVVH
jgi:hypothetical protein